MGIKSTTRLPRRRAIEMYFELLMELDGRSMSNAELGDALDRLVEIKCDREGRTCFDNFVVVADRDED